MKLRLPNALRNALAAITAASMPIATTVASGTLLAAATTEVQAAEHTLAAGETPTFTAGDTYNLCEDTTFTGVTGSITINADGHNVKLESPATNTQVENFPTLNGVNGLELAQGRYRLNASGMLDGVSGNVALTGGMLWTTENSTNTIGGNVTIQASSFSEDHDSLDYSALRIGADLTINGNLAIADKASASARDAKISFQGGKHLTVLGAMTGSADLLIGRFAGSNALNLVGGSATYTGVVRFEQEGVTIRGGANGLHFGGLVSTDTNGAIGVVSDASSTTLTLNVAQGSAYSFGGGISGGVSLVKAGAGTQTLTGTLSLTALSVTGGELVISGTLGGLQQAITVSDGATLTFGSGTTLDLGGWTHTVDWSTGVTTYNIGQGLDTANVTWSVTGGAYDPTTGLYTLSSTPAFTVAGTTGDADAAAFTWGGDSASTYEGTETLSATGQFVRFTDKVALTLGADISAPDIEIAAGGSLSLSRAGHTLTAGTVNLGGDLVLGDPSGLTVSNWTGDGKVVLQWSGDKTGGTFFANYHGEVLLKSGAKWLAKEVAAPVLSKLTIESGAHYFINANANADGYNHVGDIYISGDGFPTEDDKRGALKLGNNRKLKGDVHIVGGSAAISEWTNSATNNEHGYIIGDIISDSANGTLSLISAKASAGEDHKPLLDVVNIQGVKTVNVDKAGILTATGNVTNTGGFIKQGTGTLTIGGTFTPGGNVELQAGTLELTKAGTYNLNIALGTAGHKGTLKVGSGVTVNLGTISEQSYFKLAGEGNVNITGADKFFSGSGSTFTGLLTINLGGHLYFVPDTANTKSFNAVNGKYANIKLEGGNNDKGMMLGEAYIASNANVDGAIAKALDIGSLEGGASTRIRGDNQSQTNGNYRYVSLHQDGDTTFAGVFMRANYTSRNVGLIMNGAGTITLTGANQSRATLIANTGTIEISDSGQWNGNVVVQSGGQLYLNKSGPAFGDDCSSITLNGAGVAASGNNPARQGALKLISGSSFAKNITIGNGGASIYVDGTGESTLTGNITGGTLTKVGTGTLKLTGTMANGIVLSTGALKLGGNVRQTTTTTTMAAGTTLDLAAGSVVRVDLSTAASDASSSFVHNITGSGTLEIAYKSDNWQNNYSYVQTAETGVDNTFAGVVHITSGNVTMSSCNIGDGSFKIADSVNLQFSSDTELDNDIEIVGTTHTFYPNSSKNVTFNGDITGADGGFTLSASGIFVTNGALELASVTVTPVNSSTGGLDIRGTADLGTLSITANSTNYIKGTAEIDTLTMSNGTLTISGSADIASITLTGGSLTVNGTSDQDAVLKLTDAISGSDRVTFGRYSHIDIDDLAYGWEGTSKVWEVGAGITTAAGMTWSQDGGYYDSANGHYILENAAYSVTDNSAFTWGGDSASKFDGDKVVSGSDVPVCFIGESNVTLGVDINAPLVNIAADATVHLGGAHTLTATELQVAGTLNLGSDVAGVVTDSFVWDGTLQMSNVGVAVNATQTTLGEDATLRLAWSGRNTNISNFINSFTGNLVVAAGTSYATSTATSNWAAVNATYKTLTVEEGGQFSLEGTMTVTDGIRLSGDGVGTGDNLGALKLGQGSGTTTVNGDITVVGDSASVSLYQNLTGQINGTITGESGQSVFKLLNTNSTGENRLTVSGLISGIAEINVQRGTLTAQEGVSARGLTTFTKSGAGTLTLNKATDELIGKLNVNAGQVVLNNCTLEDCGDGHVSYTGKNDKSFMGLLFQGAMSYTGTFTIEQGTVGYGDARDATDALTISQLVVKNNGRLRIHHGEGVSRGTNIKLSGGGEIFMHDSGTTSRATVKFGTLELEGSVNLINGEWKGNLTFSELTGNGSLTANKPVHAEGLILKLESVRNYGGTITNNLDNATHYIDLGHVSQDEDITGTISGGTIKSTDFAKTGLGTLNLTSLEVSGLLAMNYEGGLSIGTAGTFDGLTVANNTRLAYTGVGSVISLSETVLSGVTGLTLDFTSLDRTALSSAGSNGINLGIAGAYAQNSLTIAGLDGLEYTLSAIDGYYHLAVAVPQAAASWDANWPLAGLANMPATVPQKNNLSGNVSLGEENGSRVNPGAAQLTGGGSASTIIAGGVYGTRTNDSTVFASYTGNTWIDAEGGTFGILVGGNVCANWKTGDATDISATALNFTGNSHIKLAGTATVDNIIGGNYQDGRLPSFTGSSYISVQGGTLRGSIVGGSTSSHIVGSKFIGNSEIWIYTPLNATGGGNIGNQQPQAVIGGNLHSANGLDTNTLLFQGDTNIHIRIPSDVTIPDGATSVDFSKMVVGGSMQYNQAGGTLKNDGNTNVEISAPGTVNFTGLVIGGSYTNNSGTLTMTGNAELVLNGGTFTTQDVIGGHYATGNANVQDRIGNIHVTIDGATVGKLYGGSYQGRNNTDAMLTQGDITVDLVSGQVTTVFAAGGRPANGNLSAASTTVNVGSAMTFGTDAAVSGGFYGSGATVTGTRTLNFNDEDYSAADFSGVTFKDFDAINAASDVTINDVVTSAFTKGGAGTLTFSAGMASAQTVDVAEGSVAVTGELSSTSGTFDKNGLGSMTVGSVASALENLNVNAGSLTVTGTVAGNLTKDGVGTLVLGKADTAMDGGTLTVAEGIVELTGGGLTAVLKGTSVLVQGGGTLKINHDSLGYSSTPADVNGLITLQGESPLVRAVLQSVDAGSNPVKNGLSLQGNSRVTGGTLQFFNITVSGSGTANDIDTTLDINGNVVFDVAADGEVGLNGVIRNFWAADANAAHSLTKQGEGTLIVTGTQNTLTRAINVTGGKLLLDGNGAGIGSGAITVSDGAVLATNGNITLGNTLGGAGLVQATGGTLTLDAGGTAETPASLGGINSLVVDSGASLTLAANNTLNFSDTILNDGTLTLNGTLHIDDHMALAEADNSYHYSDTTDGVILTDYLYFVNGSGTVHGTGTITYGTGENIRSVQVSDFDGLSYIRLERDSDDHNYYVNTDVSFSSVTGTDGAQSVALNGGTLTVAKTDTVNMDIVARQDSVLNIDKGATVGKTHVSVEGDSTITLVGEGTYALGATERALNTGVQIGTLREWTGTVLVNGATFAGAADNSLSTLGGLANDRSYVGLASSSGYFNKTSGNTTTIGYNVDFVKQGDNAALTINDDYSNQQITFSGLVKGDGTFKVGRTGTDGLSGLTMIFTNDVAGWTGDVLASFTHRDVGERAVNVKFTGDSDVNVGTFRVENSTDHHNKVTLEVTISSNASGDTPKIVSSAFATTDNGFINLITNGTNDRIFTGNVQVSTLTVAGDGATKVEKNTGVITVGSVSMRGMGEDGSMQSLKVDGTAATTTITGGTSGDGDTLEVLGKMAGLTIAFAAENTVADISNITMRDVQLRNGALSLGENVKAIATLASVQGAPATQGGITPINMSGEGDTVSLAAVKVGGSVSGSLAVDIDSGLLSPANAGSRLEWTILQNIVSVTEPFELQFGEVLSYLVNNGKTAQIRWENTSDEGNGYSPITPANMDNINTGGLIAGFTGGNLVLTVENIPEPATGTLGALALAALAARRRRRATEK